MFAMADEITMHSGMERPPLQKEAVYVVVFELGEKCIPTRKCENGVDEK